MPLRVPKRSVVATWHMGLHYQSGLARPLSDYGGANPPSTEWQPGKTRVALYPVLATCDVGRWAEVINIMGRGQYLGRKHTDKSKSECVCNTLLQGTYFTSKKPAVVCGPEVQAEADSILRRLGRGGERIRGEGFLLGKDTRSIIIFSLLRNKYSC